MTPQVPPPPFWSPALPRTEFWRTALGVVVIFVIWLGVTFGVIWGFQRVTGTELTPSGYAGTAGFFLTFLGIHAGLFVALRLVHRRGYVSLFGPARRLAPRAFALGTLFTLSAGLLLVALMGLERLVLPEGVTPRLGQSAPLGRWALGLLPALGLIFMQVLAEEAVFRGYLLQQLAARFRSRLVWAVLPALAFGLLHYDAATYGAGNAAAYVLNATVLGTFAALITARTGNLAAATGLHFGNNASMTLVGTAGSLDGFSLFTVAMDPTGPYATWSILSQTALMALAFALWWRWMARHRPIAKAARPD